MEAQLEVVRANKLESCYLRPIAFYGSEKMGISTKGATVHVAIAAWPWGAYLGAEALENGIRVKTSSYARHHVNVTMPRAKLSPPPTPTPSSPTSKPSKPATTKRCCSTPDGFVAEGAGENLFMVKDGVIYEPEIASALTGITRASVIQVAKEFGLRRADPSADPRRRLHRRRSLLHRHRRRSHPDPRLDGRIIGEGKRGPVTESCKSFFEIVNGQAPEYAHWLSRTAPVLTAARNTASAEKSRKAIIDRTIIVRQALTCIS
jgi:branched-chain amino acid aminotransferase